MESKRDWRTVSTNLQLGEIPSEDIPRLLFECIQDLNKSQDEFSGLVRDIESTIKQTKGESHDSSEDLEQEKHELQRKPVRATKRDG